MSEGEQMEAVVRRAPPEVDLGALEAELAGRLAARPAVEPPPDAPPPFLGAGTDPLDRARALLGRAGVEYEIGWRTPVLGQAWAAVRQVVHAEARLYVDALMARQAEVDAAFLEAIGRLRDEIGELRRVIARDAGGDGPDRSAED